MKFYNKKSTCPIFIFTFLLVLNLLSVSVYGEETAQKIFYLSDKGSMSRVLFTDEDTVSPGNELIKDFYVANNNDFNCILRNIVIDGKLFTNEGGVINKDGPEYKNFMDNARLEVFCGNKELYSGNADGFLNIDLSKYNYITIEGRDKKKFRIEFALDKAAGNLTMNKKYNFNIHANFALSENSSSGRLVQTGSLLDEKAVITLGAVFLIIGFGLVIKSRYN